VVRVKRPEICPVCGTVHPNHELHGLEVLIEAHKRRARELPKRSSRKKRRDYYRKIASEYRPVVSINVSQIQAGNMRGSAEMVTIEKYISEEVMSDQKKLSAFLAGLLERVADLERICNLAHVEACEE